MPDIVHALNSAFFARAIQMRLPINQDTCDLMKAEIDRLCLKWVNERVVERMSVICDASNNPPGIWSRDDLIMDVHWMHLGVAGIGRRHTMTLDAAWSVQHYVHALHVESRVESEIDLHTRVRRTLKDERQLIDVHKVMLVDGGRRTAPIDDHLFAFVHEHKSLPGNDRNARTTFVLSSKYGIDAGLHYTGLGHEFAVYSVKLL